MDPLPPHLQQQARDAVISLPALPDSTRQLSHEQQLELLQQRLAVLQGTYNKEHKIPIGFSDPDPTGKEFEPKRPVIDALKKVGDSVVKAGSGIKAKAVGVKDDITARVEEFKSNYPLVATAGGIAMRQIPGGDIQNEIDQAERAIKMAENVATARAELTARQKLNVAEEALSAPLNKAMDKFNPISDLATIEFRVRLLKGVVKDPEVNVTQEAASVAGRPMPEQGVRR
jgi:hypothetical protein